MVNGYLRKLFSLYRAIPREREKEKKQVRDRAWFVLHVRSFGELVIDRIDAQTMLCLTGTMITSVDLARCGIARAKDWVSVDCGTSEFNEYIPPPK